MAAWLEDFPSATTDHSNPHGGVALMALLRRISGAVMEDLAFMLEVETTHVSHRCT